MPNILNQLRKRVWVCSYGKRPGTASGNILMSIYSRLPLPMYAKISLSSKFASYASSENPEVHFRFLKEVRSLESFNCRFVECN